MQLPEEKQEAKGHSAPGVCKGAPSRVLAPPFACAPVPPKFLQAGMLTLALASPLFARGAEEHVSHALFIHSITERIFMPHATHAYHLLDSDNSTGRYVLIDNGEPIAEFYHETDATRSLAAPKLLEALKNLWAVCDKNGYEIPMGYRNQVFTAIAEAEGK